jgi:Protein of unknown function (DUF1501)
MHDPTCNRRDFLKLTPVFGLSFMFPLALPSLDPRTAFQRGPMRPKSLLILWLSGGPSQLETWDPHPGTPIGGPTESIDTTIPGVKIAEHFPQLAEQLHHLSLIRSLVSKEGDHDRATYAVRTGYRPDQTLRHPFVGAIVAKELPNPDLEIPAVIALGYHHEHDRPRGGYLGADYDAFEVREPGWHDGNAATLMARDRQQRRLANLDVVSRAFRKNRQPVVDRTMHQQTVDAAVRMMTSDQQQAFVIDDEPQAIRTAYGDSNFGRGCLVARRLIEQGVRAIEVTHENYDSHSNNFETHRKNAEVLDVGFAALIYDLHERELLDSTVVLCIGEFGRTPKINASDGRDHWPSGFSCVVGGGGLQGGQVIGATDPTGERKEPAEPVQIADLYATILQALGIDSTHQVATPIGRPIRYSSGTPISQLLG